MTKIQKLILVLYAALGAVKIYGNVLGPEILAIIAKPLWMPLLLIFFVLSLAKSHRHTPYFALICVSLVFACLGDVFLLDKSNKTLFLLGLVAFLLMHVCYIVIFFKLRKSNYVATHKYWIPVVYTYAIVLLAILWSNLGTLLVPVGLYATVAATMVLLAINLKQSYTASSTSLIIWGALIFVISDGILGIANFAPHITFPVHTAMLIGPTYLLAQLLLILGFVGILEEKSAEA